MGHTKTEVVLKIKNDTTTISVLINTWCLVGIKPTDELEARSQTLLGIKETRHLRYQSVGVSEQREFDNLAGPRVLVWRYHRVEDSTTT